MRAEYVRGVQRSRHTWFDDHGVLGVCLVHDNAYVFELWTRYPRELIDSSVVRRGTVAYERCVRNWREYVGKYVQRLEHGTNGSNHSLDYASCPFADEHPATWEYLTLEKDEGRRRETSTFLVSAEAGRLRACVRDRDSGMMAWVSADTWEALWNAVEAKLSGVAECDWRVDRFSQPKKGGKKA